MATNPNTNTISARASNDDQPSDLSAFHAYKDACKRYRSGYLNHLWNTIEPTLESWNVLSKIYRERIQPLFPIFPEVYLADPVSDLRHCRIFRSAVMLAAGTHPDAQDHLRIRSPTEISDPDGKSRTAYQSRKVSYKDFSRAILEFLTERLADLDKHEQPDYVIDSIRVKAILSFFWQPEPQQRSAPFETFCSVASVVHTYGIHLVDNAKANKNWDSINKGGGDMFKCLYALDRLIAAQAGRPLMFQNHDIMEVPSYRSNERPCFKLFQMLIGLLDKVIDLYRPHPTVSWIELPVFERMIIDTDATKEPDYILGRYP